LTGDSMWVISNNHDGPSFLIRMLYAFCAYSYRRGKRQPMNISRNSWIPNCLLWVLVVFVTIGDVLCILYCTYNMYSHGHFWPHRNYLIWGWNGKRWKRSFQSCISNVATEWPWKSFCKSKFESWQICNVYIIQYFVSYI
jgi:hypothetical protein